MDRIFIAYIIVFFLECCSILTPITIGPIELKFSIIFELSMFVGLLLRFNKFYSILNGIKEIKFFFLILLFSLIVISFEDYFLKSLILTLRIILILSVSFIPFVYNFNQKKITFSIKIFENSFIIYSFYTLLLFIVENQFGTRFFGPMGDTFAWILGAFIVKNFIEKKYYRFIFYLLILIVVTGSITALALSFFAVSLYSIKRTDFKAKFNIILYLSILILLILIFFPNLIYNSSLLNRFNLSGLSFATNFENNSNFKITSLLINFDEMITSLFQINGFGSTSFLADQISNNNNLITDNLDNLNSPEAIKAITLPSLEIIKFIREFGILGIFIYLNIYIRMIKRFLNSKNIGINSFLNYYLGLYMLFSFLIFQPGSLLMILLMFTIVQSIQNITMKEKVGHILKKHHQYKNE